MNVRNLIRVSENIIAAVIVFLLALFPTMEVIARKFFKTGVANSTLYTQHLVFLLAFIAAMITAREKKHLSLSLDLTIPEKLRRFSNFFVSFLSVMITASFALASVSFLLNAFDEHSKIWIIPMRLFMLILPLSFIVMSIRFLAPVQGRGQKVFAAAIGLSLGIIISLSTISDIFSGFGWVQPDILQTLLESFTPLIPALSLLLIGLLLVSSVFGTPIFILMGGIALLLFIRNGAVTAIIPNEAYSMLIDISVPAIPLFAITGFILSESKAGERLVRLFRSLFGWFPGGLAVMAILVCAFFTTFTGASGVTILALGALLSVVLVKGEYPKRFSLGLLTSSGSIGLLFPPSLPIIIYGISAQVSIKDMFIGGIAPGALMVLALILYGIFSAKRKKVPTERFHLKEAALSIKESIWEILLPVIIIMSYFGGLTTLVESSAIAVIYSLFIQVILKRDLKIRDLMSVVNKSVPIIGGVLIILW